MARQRGRRLVPPADRPGVRGAGARHRRHRVGRVGSRCGSATNSTGTRATARSRRVRVRGLNNHGQPVEEVHRGQRAGVNLAGVPHEAVRRGQELATPGYLGREPGPHGPAVRVGRVPPADQAPPPAPAARRHGRGDGDGVAARLRPGRPRAVGARATVPRRAGHDASGGRRSCCATRRPNTRSAAGRCCSRSREDPPPARRVAGAGRAAAGRRTRRRGSSRPRGSPSSTGFAPADFVRGAGMGPAEVGPLVAAAHRGRQAGGVHAAAQPRSCCSTPSASRNWRSASSTCSPRCTPRTRC